MLMLQVCWYLEVVAVGRQTYNVRGRLYQREAKSGPEAASEHVVLDPEVLQQSILFLFNLVNLVQLVQFC